MLWNIPIIVWIAAVFALAGAGFLSAAGLFFRDPKGDITLIMALRSRKVVCIRYVA